jgi:gliding motility-associated-like protein
LQKLREAVGIPFTTDEYRICPGDTLNITVPTTDALLWLPHPSLLDADTSKLMRILPAESTQVSFRITNSLGCTYDGSIQIILFPPLPAFITEADPDTIAQGAGSQLNTTLYPGFTYQWNPSSTLDNEFTNNPVARPRTTTTYSVTITSPDGCSLIQNITVTVMTFPCEDTHVFIPNAFSPNGDSINETWNVRSVNLDFYTLMVYDRWGKEVFRTQSQDYSWDGTYSGKPLPKGSYGYYFEGLCLDGTPIIKKGNVTIF